MRMWMSLVLNVLVIFPEGGIYEDVDVTSAKRVGVISRGWYI